MSRPRLPSIALLLFVIAYLGLGYLTLDQTTRLVPMLAGGVTLLLLAIEMARAAVGRGGATTPNVEHARSASSRRELIAIAYVAGVVGAVYLLGFLVAIPIYLFTSIAYLGKQSIRTALALTLLTTLAIYLLFAVALDYELYRGILFT